MAMNLLRAMEPLYGCTDFKKTRYHKFGQMSIHGIQLVWCSQLGHRVFDSQPYVYSVCVMFLFLSLHLHFINNGFVVRIYDVFCLTNYPALWGIPLQCATCAVECDRVVSHFAGTGFCPWRPRHHFWWRLWTRTFGHLSSDLWALMANDCPWLF